MHELGVRATKAAQEETPVKKPRIYRFYLTFGTLRALRHWTETAKNLRLLPRDFALHEACGPDEVRRDFTLRSPNDTPKPKRARRPA